MNNEFARMLFLLAYALCWHFCAADASGEIMRTYDVVVCGGSSGAVAAAIAAKKAGADVMLIAPRTYLGEDIAGELNLGEGRETPLAVKKSLDKVMVDAGVEFVTGAVATGTLADKDGVVAGVVVDSRSGRKTVRARVVVDATSRATVARLAGAKTAPFLNGRYRFTRRVVSREAPHVEGLAVRQLPGELKVEERMGGWNRKVVGVSTGMIYECSFMLPMCDGSSRSFALAEQMGRDLTWTAEQLDAADTMHFIAPDHIIAKKGCNDRWKGVDAIPLAAMMPMGVEGMFVLGALADVPREVAEEMTKPENYSALGRRAGRMAADVAKVRQIGANVQERENALPILASCDVFVAGAGTGGAPAGIAAARGGAKTIICDPLHKMGGVETDSLIGWYCFGNRVGFTAEIDKGIRSLGPDGEQTRAEWFRRECRRSGAEVWFGASAAGVVMSNGVVTGVIVVMPGGERGLVGCKVAIDATGRAVLPRFAGLPTEFYAENEGSVQGAGMTPRQLGAKYNNTDIGFVDDDDAEDVTFFALRSRMSLPTDSVWDLAQGVGTRDRRHIVGDLYIRPVDVYVGRRYPDTVVVARSNFDSHGQTVDRLFLISDSHRKALFANIPYRAFLPKGAENLLVVGLGISAHRDAMPVLRMQPDVQNQGYAAGMAAAMAIADGVTTRNIDVKRLQRKLVRARILPEEALDWKDSFPLPDNELERAVAAIPDGYAGFPVLMTDTVRAVPLLRRAYAAAKSASDRVAYAHALAVMGDKTGEDDLIAALTDSAWDKGWDFKGMAQFGRCASLQDSYIFALGICVSKKAVPTIVAKAEALGPDDAYSHFRAVSLALEKIGEKSAAAALAALLDKPNVAGHAVAKGAIPAIEGYSNKAADRERTRCLREITLARGLYRLGDVDGRGRRVLESYAADPRKVYANYCLSILNDPAARATATREREL